MGKDNLLLEIWKDGKAELRREILTLWTNMGFSLTLNGIIIAVIFNKFDSSSLSSKYIIVLLSILGIVVWIILYKVFSLNRKYFLGMLRQTTMIEQKLGFFDNPDDDFELQIPKRIRDMKELENAVKDKKEWVRKTTWKGPMIRGLRYIYFLLLTVYIFTLICGFIGLYCKVIKT